MRPTRQFWAIFWTLAVVLAALIAWFLGNLLYSLFWKQLGDWGFPITEAQMIAYICAHLVPFVLALLVMAILAALIRNQLALAKAHTPDFASDTSSTDSLAKMAPTPSDPFKLSDKIYFESRSVKTTGGSDAKLYETVFYLVVSNDSGDGTTVRNIQAELVGYETPVVAAVRGSLLDRIDLKHGQAVFFLIGRTVGTDFLGNFVGDITYVPDKIRRYIQNMASSRKPTFEVWSFDNVYRYGLNDDKEKTDWGLDVVISADDKKSKRVALKVTPTDAIPIKYAEGECPGSVRTTPW